MANHVESFVCVIETMAGINVRNVLTDGTIMLEAHAESRAAETGLRAIEWLNATFGVSIYSTARVGVFTHFDCGFSHMAIGEEKFYNSPAEALVAIVEAVRGLRHTLAAMLIEVVVKDSPSESAPPISVEEYLGPKIMEKLNSVEEFEEEIN